MLYKKNLRKELSDILFRNPTCEYRGAPFWAWNCKLDKDELLRQTDVLREMGFGGYHMHVRSGMDTKYLSDDFMNLIEACTEKAEKNRMLAWLYDEDRWPSGFAGGYVTKDEKYRIRYLLFTPQSYEEKAGLHREGNEQASQIRSGLGNLLARYDVKLDSNGCLKSYKLLSDGENAEGSVWYAYVESPHCSPRYNGFTYANLMDKATIDRFIEVTHEKYKERVGSYFGKTVPAIFTDEPQFSHKQTLPFPESKKDVTLPWTDDLPETFKAAYGMDIVSALPELIWELPEGVSRIRYFYHDHACQRFTDSFAKNLGSWCEKNGISLTGHMMKEPTLSSQTMAVGEVMRSLAAFQLPGIDMLADRHEYTTAKQAASIAHQYGREGVMSELYGVTNWDYDFRGHKLQGDWQAALGVTVRVPHLAWVSMEGEAKRDYPASINYQSSWYKKYSYVENHFARLNTALTRGRPDIRIGVIHPVESMWIHWGPSYQTEAVRSGLDGNFDNITQWLLFGGFDFDFISESILPEECDVGGYPLQVGKMKYDAIVVPGCETLRKTTVDRLLAFRRAGGKLLFVGKAPEYMDAMPSDEPARLYAESENCEFTRPSVLEALEDIRTVEMRNAGGSLTDNLLYQLREDGKKRWLCVVHGKNPANKDLSQLQKVIISVNGLWDVTLYDTLNGEIRDIPYKFKNGKTVISQGLYAHDSMLLKLTPATSASAAEFVPATPLTREKTHNILALKGAAYKRNEPNALLLDCFDYSFDGGEWRGPEEILRIDTAIRRELGWDPWGGSATQPWCIVPEPIEHSLSLRTIINTSFCLRAPMLAIEAAEDSGIYIDGDKVESKACGYYTDKSIKTVKLPMLKKGSHTLELVLPFGKRTAAERIYLLGNFKVNMTGTDHLLIPDDGYLAFDDVTHQGLPFYGGSITYAFDVETELDNLEIRLPHYRAAVYEISLDGGKKITGAYAPYSTRFSGVKPGKHRVEITLYISRHNAFGNIHNADEKLSYPGPGTWRSSGDSWTYQYRLLPEGLLSAPVIREFE